jgi:hypothetical protein
MAGHAGLIDHSAPLAVVALDDPELGDDLAAIGSMRREKHVKRRRQSEIVAAALDDESPFQRPQGLITDSLADPFKRSVRLNDDDIAGPARSAARWQHPKVCDQTQQHTEHDTRGPTAVVHDPYVVLCRSHFFLPV